MTAQGNARRLLAAEEERDRLKAAGAPKDVIEAADEVIFAARYGTSMPAWALDRVLSYAKRGQQVNRFGRTV